ncbi:phospholipase D family protein [Xanthomonas sp. D-109]|uniref:phospholipase D family protein n=1 Tax=Xanthomonas sp. D-109 TaxID=2821274 RepID=UPI001AD96535|nr:phospholipase D family protein [Xanthomonas sp. D-109]MBO9883560.1 phospholipase D family protein [Xanthomonas sp. D-109]
MVVLIKDQTDLVEWIKGQDADLDLAVAFWGKSASTVLQLNKPGRIVRVILELSQGATNIAEVRILMTLSGVQIKTLDRLHAKVYIGTDEMVIGSANASSGGLGVAGFEHLHWKELGLRTSDQASLAEAKAWFEVLWSDARTIEPTELDRLEKLQEIRKKQAVPMVSNGSTLDALKKHPEFFADQAIWVTVVTSKLSDAQEKKRQERQLENPDIEVYAYAQWRKMPQNATIISFTWYPGEKFKADKPLIYQTPDGRQRGEMQYIQPGKLPWFELGDLKQWESAVIKFRDSNLAKWKREHGIYMRLRDFREYIL